MTAFRRRGGQTLVETAFILFLLLLILLGITEFARAWYTKNSLKNAARQGARMAVVTSFSPGLGPSPIAAPPPDTGSYSPCTESPCPTLPYSSETDIRNAVCCSPGVRNDGTTHVSVTYTDDNSSGALNTGDTVYVYANTTFGFILGGAPWPWPGSITITTNASMRYE